jgi:hypothetical protein
MPYNPIMPSMKLTAQDMGVPDYVQALQSGLQTASDVYKPRRASEDLLAQMLANKMNKPKAEGAQLSFDTDIGYKQALTNAANRPPQMSGEAAQLFALRNQFPEGSPDRASIDAMIAQKARGAAGTTVYDPTTGNPLVQIGGAAGKSGGGTFFNPVTGEMTSQPTGATASNLQQRVVGAEALKPYLDKVTESMPQFQNPMTQASLLGQKVANAFGGQNFPLPSEKAAGKAAIKEASEGMLKTFGLNATGANRQAMEDILTPHFGESPEGYKNRVQEQAATYAKNQELASSALRGGINIGKASNQAAPKERPVAAGKIRVYFPDGPHVIPRSLLEEAKRSGATLEREL